MDDILDVIKQQAIEQSIRVAQHARQAMAEELITLDITRRVKL